MSLEWTYGRVSKFTKDGFTQTCTYDANGIRTEKIENGKTHKYYVEDSRIVREVVTGSENYELYYLYGANGIAGFTHKTANGSTTYYYRKNLLGDVTAIYDAAGVCKAEYAYDAWGNCTVISDMGGIGALNPIRYRGYYWDDEIALYYLNARYYDSEVGRFISQDSIKYLAPETLNGINLFAYCLNNPVMETDPQGTFGILASLLIVAAITLAVVAVDAIIETEILMNSEQYSVDNVVKRDSEGNIVGVQIKNSAAFNNPIAQFIYSKYLYDNVKNSDGSNFFTGDVYDIVGEWQAHNLAADISGFGLAGAFVLNIFLSNAYQLFDDIYSIHQSSVHLDLGSSLEVEKNRPLVYYISQFYKWYYKIFSFNCLNW